MEGAKHDIRKREEILSDKITPLTTKRIELTNNEFIWSVFRDDALRCHVTMFVDDPTTLDAQGLRHYWAGGPWKDADPTRGENPTLNSFFVISVFHPDPDTGQYRRRKANFDLCYCVVIDDVCQDGEEPGDGNSAKVPWNKIKLDPSWSIETSPGNMQIGYILKEGDPRGGKVNALLDGMVASGLVADGTDPGMKGVTRYVRLPVGMNTKAKYGDGFKHRVRAWFPEKTYTLEDIAEAYGLKGLVDNTADDMLGSANAKVVIDPDADWQLRVLSDAGMLHSEGVGAGGGRLWHVTCPWIERHSQRANSGTVYMGGGRWDCRHRCSEWCDHDNNPQYEKFDDKLEELYPDLVKQAKQDVLQYEFGDGDQFGPEADAPSGVEDKKVEEEWDAALPDDSTKRVSWLDRQDAHTGPPDFIIPGYIPRGILTSLYGKDGEGKTTLALYMAMCLAVGINPITDQQCAPQKVMMLSAEDPESVIIDRFNRIAKYRGFGMDDYVDLDENLIYPDVMQMDVKMFFWDVQGHREPSPFTRHLYKRLDVIRPDLLILDPISDLFEDNENDRARVSGFLRHLNQLAHGRDMGLMLLGHPSKAADSEYSGSTAWSTKVRSRMQLSRDEETDTINLYARKTSWSPPGGEVIELEWTDGVLHPVAGVAAAKSQFKNAEVERQILVLIRDRAENHREVFSASSQARSYLPKVAEREGLLDGRPVGLVRKVFSQMLGDTLVPDQVFDGTNGTPTIARQNGVKKEGVWWKSEPDWSTLETRDDFTAVDK